MSQDPRTEDLGFARVDLDRAARTGDAEVVYGAGKTPEQVVAILRTLHDRHPERAVLATRLSDEAMRGRGRARRRRRRGGPGGRARPAARPRRGWCASSAPAPPTRPSPARPPWPRRVHGAEVDEVRDVGVAGLHRLLAVHDQLHDADCLVVVAGMEGALPSVVGGLTGVPMVAVPTSVGYGASFGGLAALLAMLNSCAPGVVVVNIDNGYGAGVHAARVARRAAPRGSAG